MAKVSRIPTGLKIDREAIIDILDPNKFPMIKKIEGDSVYLQQPETMRSVDDAQVDKEQKKIAGDAAKQAVKGIKGKA